MRLSAYIAKSGFCSRRKAADLIKEGKVRLNEKIVYEPWIEIKENSKVEVNGKLLNSVEKTYLIFNKPKGVTTTLKDKFAQKKVSDYIPKKYGRVFPVGRLDKDSRGLIILTNNGDFCFRHTHPKFEVEKEYVLLVKGKINPKDIRKLKKGIKDKNDFLKVKKAVVESIEKGRTKIKITVCEGKKRHLRRLFKSLGFEVLDLKRIRIGRFELGNLKEGSFKPL